MAKMNDDWNSHIPLIGVELLTATYRVKHTYSSLEGKKVVKSIYIF